MRGDKQMIEVKNLSYTYTSDEDNGLKNVNLLIRKGEFVVLCGRSGCGKTTLTRALNGLIPHFFEGGFSGQVSVERINISDAELSKTADLIGSVFQNPASQFFHIDTDGELAFGCENLAMEPEQIRRRVKKSVIDLHLEALTGRNIFELSGGEKQQIACGSVYAANPKVYVLDEPSSNLDVKAVLRLRQILQRLKQEGNTIVIAEHRLYYLVELADRFVYMDNSTIAQCFSSKELLQMPNELRQALGLRIPDLSKVETTVSEYKESNNAMEITDLICKRNKREILSVHRLSIPKHAVIAVIGKNGAGKSTFAECISGLQKCSGQIITQGQLCKPKERVRRSFLVMQDVNRQLFCDSVLEEITMGSSNSNPDEAKELLDLMNLSSLADKHPASLSGGQKQRVAICAAIYAKKKWLFYDEPTSGLDYDGMQHFADLLKMNQDKTEFSFVITHDMELVMSGCTHVLHLEKGKLKEFYRIDGSTQTRLRQFFLCEEREEIVN